MIDYDKLKEKFKADFAVQFPDEICDWFMDEIRPLIQVQPTVELFSIERDDKGKYVSLGMFRVISFNWDDDTGMLQCINILRPLSNNKGHYVVIFYDRNGTGQLIDNTGTFYCKL